MKGYRAELVQVAASALVAAQVYNADTTAIDVGSVEGRRGKLELEGLLDAVRAEREAQELKWGTRTNRDANPMFWLAVLMEEVGEVAEEIAPKHTAMSATYKSLLDLIIEAGRRSRALLEAPHAI